MYQNTILKPNNLKQAHTNTIYYILRKKIILPDSENSGEFSCLSYFEIKAL